MFFVGFVAPTVAGYTLLFALIPSVYIWRSKRRYKWGKEAFIVSCSMFGVVLILWLGFEPLRRFIIFH